MRVSDLCLPRANCFLTLGVTSQQAKAEYLERLAYQTKYPMPGEVHGAITRGTHGTTPRYRQSMKIEAAKDQRRRDKMQYREEVGRCQHMMRAMSCLPNVEAAMHAKPRPSPQKLPRTPRREVKVLSQVALEGMQRMVWWLMERYPNISEAFRVFDKDRSGSISTAEFRGEVEKMMLGIDAATMDEMMAFLDIGGDGVLQLHEVQKGVNDVMSELHTQHWMDRTAKFHTGVREQKTKKLDAAAEAVPLDVIVDSVNSKCLARMPEMQRMYDVMRTEHRASSSQTKLIQGIPRSAFVKKSEMRHIFVKSSISILSSHFDMWWDSLVKQDGRVRWSTFVEAIQNGRDRGRGRWLLNDVPHSKETVQHLAHSPEIQCLRSPDLLSPPNRWGVTGYDEQTGRPGFSHVSAGFDNRRFDGMTYVIGATKNTGGARAEIVPARDNEGVRKSSTIPTMPAFPHPDRRFGTTYTYTHIHTHIHTYICIHKMYMDIHTCICRA